VIGGAAFLLLMIRPFLRHISKESRRCAELLVQLPPNFDVEGMVAAATWSVVKKVGGHWGGGNCQPTHMLVWLWTGVTSRYCLVGQTVGAP
jgi:hypothetical protein